MLAKTQTKSSREFEKLKQPMKLNKKILIAKTLEAFTRRQTLFPLNIPILKISSKPIFVSEIGPVLYLRDLKKCSLALEDRPLKMDL